MVQVQEFPSNFGSTKVLKIIATEVYEGKGTQEDIGRIVTYYSDLNGKLLAVNDPCPGGKHPDEEVKNIQDSVATVSEDHGSSY